MVPAEPKLKCAAGTLRAYLRRCTDDAKASFVSSRSLALGGSWGTAPSVFWFLLYAQKERPGGEPYRPSPFGDFVTPLGDYNLSPPGRRTGLAPCKISTPPLGAYKFGPKILLLLSFIEKYPPPTGEMKLRHGFCRQSLRLISFATSLYTREAFASRRPPSRPKISFCTISTKFLSKRRYHP